MRSFIYIALFCASLISCNEKTNVQFPIQIASIPIDAALKADSSILEIYKPYKLGLDSIMNEVICYSPFFLEKSKPESRLSNWMADVCLNTLNEKYEVDFCLLNYGGIRSTLPKGDIITKNIFQLMPFENELVIIEIPDSSFTKALNYLKQSAGHPISGIELNIQNDRLTHSLSPKGAIKIATSDYLANGGDQMFFFADSLQMIKTGLKIRDALLLECKAIDTLYTTIDNRFVYE
jgi:5'-nucleotidase